MPRHHHQSDPTSEQRREEIAGILALGVTRFKRDQEQAAALIADGPTTAAPSLEVDAELGLTGDDGARRSTGASHNPGFHGTTPIEFASAVPY